MRLRSQYSRFCFTINTLSVQIKQSQLMALFDFFSHSIDAEGFFYNFHMILTNNLFLIFIISYEFAYARCLNILRHTDGMHPLV